MTNTFWFTYKKQNQILSKFHLQFNHSPVSPVGSDRLNNQANKFWWSCHSAYVCVCVCVWEEARTLASILLLMKSYIGDSLILDVLCKINEDQRIFIRVHLVYGSVFFSFSFFTLNCNISWLRSMLIIAALNSVLCSIRLSHNISAGSGWLAQPPVVLITFL